MEGLGVTAEMPKAQLELLCHDDLTDGLESLWIDEIGDSKFDAKRLLVFDADLYVSVLSLKKLQCINEFDDVHGGRATSEEWLHQRLRASCRRMGRRTTGQIGRNSWF